jgi:hypothetical protein
LSDRSLLLAKAETVYGTDSVPTAANYILAENVRPRLMGQRERGKVAKPGVGQTSGFVVGEHIELSFEVPLAASGTAGTAPKWGPLMKSCGWAETIVAVTSVTYALHADPQTADSQTIVWRDGRRLHKVVGWRGRVGLRLAALKRPMLIFTGKGLYAEVTTAALPVHADATFTGWFDARPIAQGRTTFSLNAVATTLRELSIEASDNVLFNDLPHQENVTLRGERTFSGSVKASTPLPSALNLEAMWTGGAVVTAALVHGTTAGQIVTLNTKAQYDQPEYGEENGEDIFTQPFSLQPSTLALDDEIALVLT